MVCDGAGLICLCWVLFGLDHAAVAFNFGGVGVSQPLASICDVCHLS